MTEIDAGNKASAVADPVTAEDERWMRTAIEEAYAGERTPGAGEVGCCIVRNGELLVRGHNEAELRHDPTAHAEIVCLRKLGEKLGTVDFSVDYSGCTLYCTLQPCSMCAAACVWAGIRRVVYGAGRGEVHADYFDARHLNAADVITDAYREDITLTGGVLAEECARLYAKPDGAPAEKDGAGR